MTTEQVIMSAVVRADMFLVSAWRYAPIVLALIGLMGLLWLLRLLWLTGIMIARRKK